MLVPVHPVAGCAAANGQPIAYGHAHAFNADAIQRDSDSHTHAEPYRNADSQRYANAWGESKPNRFAYPGRIGHGITDGNAHAYAFAHAAIFPLKGGRS